MHAPSIRAVAVATVAGFFLASTAGCQTAGKRTAAGAGIGAGAGALLGAGVGALTKGKKGALVGAGIGAGVGALAGGSVGLYLDKQAKELEQVAETKRTENGILVNMKNDILFDVGSADLKTEAVTQITKMGDIIAKYADDRVRIEGHTDATGSDKTNQELSVRRAEAVRTILVGRGVKEEQLTAEGFGKNKPIAPNDTPANRAKNRRVEVHIDVPNPT
ncbi:MAG TPA: OmpA family protein [Anaeromyxobacteraceae bacterium]|nr:OmpA family protein [Anaeromyxobacteraceae bacterium]